MKDTEQLIKEVVAQALISILDDVKETSLNKKDDECSTAEIMTGAVANEILKIMKKTYQAQ